VTDDEKAASPGNRLFTYLARAASVGTITSPMVLLDTDDELREHAEESLSGIGSGKGAVILGRAAAVILAGRPRAMHVRLDGPAARRIKAAASIDGVPESVAAEHQAQTDKSRELWVKRLYRADPTDPKWYHLWIDATRFDNDGLVTVISTAFERFLADNWA
jgi:cytidylate kinase